AHPSALFACLFPRTTADVERLWPLTNEGVANRSFRTLDDLEEAQVQLCVLLQNQPEVIRSLTHFHWWPPFRLKTSVIHRIWYYTRWHCASRTSFAGKRVPGKSFTGTPMLSWKRSRPRQSCNSRADSTRHALSASWARPAVHCTDTIAVVKP